MKQNNFALRMPSGMMERLRKRAEKDGISINQFINVSLAGTLSAIETEEFFRERGSRADRTKTLEILSRAGKGNPPVPGDELPEDLKSEATKLVEFKAPRNGRRSTVPLPRTAVRKRK
jgi:hypothetical protein